MFIPTITQLANEQMQNHLDLLCILATVFAYRDCFKGGNMTLSSVFLFTAFQTTDCRLVMIALCAVQVSWCFCNFSYLVQPPPPHLYMEYQHPSLCPSHFPRPTIVSCHFPSTKHRCKHPLRFVWRGGEESPEGE
jgi:hypothetical protein